MQRDLRHLARHSAVYTVGNILYRGAAFILVPLYGHYLEPAEYGTLEIFYVTSAIFQSLLASAVAHSTLRFYFEYDRVEDRKAVVSTALIANLVVTSCGALLVSLASPFLSSVLFQAPRYAFAFCLVSLGVVVESSREINLAFLRAREESVKFVAVSLVQLAIQVLANLYTVVMLRKGFIGVLEGNLAANTVVCVILTGFTLRACGSRFEYRKLLSMVRYAVPLMIASVVSATFSSADRYILNAYTSLSSLGIYALAARVAQAVPILVVDPFTTSFGPFRFAVMRERNAEQMYARIVTYYMFLATLVVLGLSVFAREAVTVASSPSYWDAAGVVPLLLIPSALAGVTYCFQTAIYIKRTTSRIFHITMAAGCAGIVADLVLIPRWGVKGAAVAGLLASLCSMLLTYAISQKLYPVRFELGRIAKILVAGIVAGAVGFQVPEGHFLITVGLKLLVLAGFPVLVGAMGGYNSAEARAVRELWEKIRMKLECKAAVQ